MEVVEGHEVALQEAEQQNEENAVLELRLQFADLNI